MCNDRMASSVDKWCIILHVIIHVPNADIRGFLASNGYEVGVYGWGT